MRYAEWLDRLSTRARPTKGGSDKALSPATPASQGSKMDEALERLAALPAFLAVAVPLAQ
jgi:hypothetical protein